MRWSVAQLKDCFAGGRAVEPIVVGQWEFWTGVVGHLWATGGGAVLDGLWHLFNGARIATTDPSHAWDIIAGMARGEWNRFKDDPAGWIVDQGTDILVSVNWILRAFCFPAGTPVPTATGLKRIEEIQQDELLWAFNPATGEWGFKPVVEPLARRYQGPMVKVAMAQFGRGGESKREELEATGDHPFWVMEGESLGSRPEPAHVPSAEPGCVLPGRWVDAIDLQVGDALIARDGARLRVEQLAVREADERVYNAHVAEWHTFAVGELAVLVHNSRKAPKPQSQPRRLNRGPTFRGRLRGARELLQRV